MNEIQAQGITHSIFGDIFLEDLRQYREKQLNTIGIQAVFPLWKQNTSDLIREFLKLGFKTIVTCVNGMYLDKSFAGRVIDQQFLDDLPKNVDPVEKMENSIPLHLTGLFLKTLFSLKSEKR
jgi:diphthamide synthase (EF-2-diphthine--ammonia ligase)